MNAMLRGRKSGLQRVRFSLTDDPKGSVPLPLPSRRLWPVGIVVGAMLAIFGGIAVGQITSMQGHEVDTVFDLMFLLFQGFWVLGWSVGVVFLFLLTLLFLFYAESARITGNHLVHVNRLGPLKILVDYDLAKLRNLRVVDAGPGRGRLRFGYGDDDRDHGLGNDMPRGEAEARVRTIRLAAEALRRGESPAAAEVTLRPEPTHIAAPAPARSSRSAPPPALSSPSALALIGANLVPLAGVLALGWDLGVVMTLFWAENAVVGFYNLLKLAVVAKWGFLFVGPFFVGHFGGFMAGHFLFIYYLFVRGIGGANAEAGAFAALGSLFVPLWPALLALLLSHGVSFYTNFLRGNEHVGRKVADQMAEPYKRIIVLHVTIIFGGWLILLLKSPLLALILLIGLKTAVDLRAHRNEHGGKTPRRTAQPGTAPPRGIP